MWASFIAVAGRRNRAILLFLLAFLPGLGAAQITINEEAKLYAAAPASPDGHGGSSVSISGATAAVGAPNTSNGKGAVYIFVRNIGTNVWTLQQTLTASNGVAGDNFGAAVSLSGNVVAIGAPNRNAGAGAVYTFTRGGSTWTQAAALTATGGAAGDQLGFSVAIEGLTVVAGAPHSTVGARSDEGTAYVFTSLNGGLTWQQQFHIQVTSGQAQGGDHIGWSVALSQGTILAGAPDDNYGNKTAAGSVYVFVRNGTTWSQQTRLNQGGGSNSANARFGTAVGLFSNTAVVGVDGKNSAQGVAYVFVRNGTTWGQQAVLSASDAFAGDHFGSAVATSGTQVVVGAAKANAVGAGSGKAYVFSRSGTTWSELAFLKASDNATGDNFGAAVSLDSGRSFVGAPFNASNAITGNGAAYSFVSQSASATTITNITPEPTVLGQSYTVSVQVASSPAGNGTPTGTVVVSDGVGATCSFTLDANGLGSCALATTSAGSQTISANYSGDAIFGASSATAPHTVNGATTATMINAETPDPSVVGQSVNVTVSVTSGTAGTITGPVTVNGPGGASCTVADISLGNSCALTILVAGSGNISATYGGDANFNSSTSAPVTHTTNKASTTTTIQSETPDPSTVGQAVTVTVGVAANAPGGGTPAGAVTVSNGTDQCMIADIAATTSCQITFSATGVSTLTATYAGNANYTGSASSGRSHTATPAATTTSIVYEAPDPSFAGQNVQVTVNVAPSTSGTPTGSVVVTDGVAMCTITLPSATNSCLMTFSVVGTSNLVATYSGDANFGGSVSGSVSHTVSAPTALHLAFNQQPADVLRGNTLSGVTVEVRDISNAVVTSDNSTQITLSVPTCSGTALALIGPVTVSNGVATFTNLPPHFYTLATGLQAGAQSNPALTPDTSATFNVLANSALLFASGFESCRL